MDRIFDVVYGGNIVLTVDLARIVAIKWRVMGTAWEGLLYTTEQERPYIIEFNQEGKESLDSAWKAFMRNQNRIFTWIRGSEFDTEGNPTSTEDFQIDLENVTAVLWGNTPESIAAEFTVDIYLFDSLEPVFSLECTMDEKHDFQAALTGYGVMK